MPDIIYSKVFLLHNKNSEHHVQKTIDRTVVLYAGF